MKNSIKGTKGGAWTLETHKKLYGDNFNNGASEWMLKHFQPKSVLEFGCGVGWYSNFFSNNGTSTVHAIEPEVMDQSLFDKEKGCIQFAFDITKDPIPKEIEEMQYDLVYSIEVMEHIELKYHSQIFDFLASKSKNIVFSGARVGQAGTGHIACRPEEEWRQEFLDRGFVFIEDFTKEIRKASNKRNTNHIKNLQVFKKA